MDGMEYVSVRICGAAGDGLTDDTQALVAAIEAAKAGCGVVYFPSGVYALRPVTVPAHITLLGRSAWGFGDTRAAGQIDNLGTAVLRALPGAEGALLNIPDAHGVRVVGLTLEGALGGEGLRGVSLAGGEGLCASVEDCLLRGFSGCGVSAERASDVAFRRLSVRDGRACAISLRACAGVTVLDCAVSDNAGAGLSARDTRDALVAAVRFDRNLGADVDLTACECVQINGCCFDRAADAAVRFVSLDGAGVTGCVFSGGGEPRAEDARHLVFEGNA